MIGKYKYGSNWHGQKVMVHIVAQEIERLIDENDGALRPEIVVRSAKKAKSPIHRCFEWNDKLAAHAYRLQQATQLLRSVTITTETAEGPIEVRAFPNIESEESSYYTTIARVMKDDEMTEQLDSQILRELIYLKNKYGSFKQFKAVWDAIDGMTPTKKKAKSKKK